MRLLQHAQIRFLARQDPTKKDEDWHSNKHEHEKNNAPTPRRRKNNKLRVLPPPGVPLFVIPIILGCCILASLLTTTLLNGQLLATLEENDSSRRRIRTVVDPSTLMMQSPPPPGVVVVAVSTPTHGKDYSQSRTRTTTTQQHVNFVWHEGAIQFLDARSSTSGAAAALFQVPPAILSMEQQPPDLEEDDDDDDHASSSEEQPPPDLDPAIPDYGGLEYHSLKQVPMFVRRIQIRDRELYDMDQQHRSSFVDPPAHETFDDHDLYQEEQDDPSREHCRRNNWAMQVYPTCNQIHELVLGRGLVIPSPYNNTNNEDYSRRSKQYEQDYNVEYLSEGSFRLTFLFERPDYYHNDNDEDDEFVLKPLLFGGHKDMDRFFRQQLYAVPTEVAILQGLTASPRITDIYGYCGSTTMQEVLPEEIETLLEPFGDTADQEDLDILQQVDGQVHPKNNLTAMEKLDLALGMAEAVADIHGFIGGVIVHGDLHHAQFMKNRQGKVKMNDFNLGSILEWNDRDQKYCPRMREPWCYEVRSPEEMFGIPFDEKIDIFSFGNAIYSMLVGLSPWYDLPRIGKSKAVCKMIADHKRAFLDPGYRKRSSIETQLIAIMEQMWAQEPEDRPDIFTIINFLRNVKKEETATNTKQIRKRVTHSTSSESSA